MRNNRPFTALSLGLVMLVGAGCSQSAAILPTDQHAKDIASQAPPPIMKPGGTPSATNAADTKQPLGKTKLKGMSK
jgi:hypothetical protein